MNNGWGPTSLPASNSLLACGSRLHFAGVGPGTRWTGVHRGRTGVVAHLESQTVRPPHPAEWPHRSWCSPAHSGWGTGASSGPMPVPAPGPAPENLEGTGEFMGLCCSPGASDWPCLGHSVYCVPSVCHGAMLGSLGRAGNSPATAQMCDHSPMPGGVCVACVCGTQRKGCRAVASQGCVRDPAQGHMGLRVSACEYRQLRVCRSVVSTGVWCVAPAPPV